MATKKKKIYRFSPDDIRAAEAQILEQNKRIEFYLTEYSVEILANKMENGDFFVPAYQRDDTWEPERKSRFIESLLMGLPIPFLFFWEMQDGKLEIVDGSQRLRTIKEFVLGDFQLGELDVLTHCEGFKFSDLPESRQRKVKNRSIRGIVLNENADEQARFDMFERINTSSKVANKAEVRRGALAGPFMDMVIDLAKDELFVRLAPLSEKLEKERMREELVTRFFAYGDGLEDYRDRPAEFLFNYTKKMNEKFGADGEAEARYRERFETTMSFIDRVFPYGFRKAAKGTATRNARFEGIAIGSYKALKSKPELRNDPNVDVSDWIAGEEFADVTGSDGANAVARLRGRIEFVHQKLLGE